MPQNPLPDECLDVHVQPPLQNTLCTVTLCNNCLLNEQVLFITKCDRVVLQSATALFITKCDRVVLQSVTALFITKCAVITKRDGTHSMLPV